jgi:hypothetical protein
LARARLYVVPVRVLLPHLSEGDAMSWKWNTEPLGRKDKCSMCQQSLRVQGDGGIVIWTDSNHYHVWSCWIGWLSGARSRRGRPRMAYRTGD